MLSKRIASLAAMAALALAVIAIPAQAAVRHLDGTIVSKNAGNHSFQIKTQSGNVRIRVTSSTKFQRISGFGGLHKGLAVEVEATSTSNGLVATHVETRGGGGGSGGGGADDNGGDNHGGGGGGADDGPNHT
jgi:Domain of unknown function (DUF5666)